MLEEGACLLLILVSEQTPIQQEPSRKNEDTLLVDSWLMESILLYIR